MCYGHREGPSEAGIRRGEVKSVDFHQRPPDRLRGQQAFTSSNYSIDFFNKIS
jgi:hypothetical protein